jgi:hypothetical protein
MGPSQHAAARQLARLGPWSTTPRTASFGRLATRAHSRLRADSSAVRVARPSRLVSPTTYRPGLRRLPRNKQRLRAGRAVPADQAMPEPDRSQHHLLLYRPQVTTRERGADYEPLPAPPAISRLFRIRRAFETECTRMRDYVKLTSSFGSAGPGEGSTPGSQAYTVESFAPRSRGRKFESCRAHVPLQSAADLSPRDLRPCTVRVKCACCRSYGRDEARNLQDVTAS